jgi:hypothetical protein
MSPPALDDIATHTGSTLPIGLRTFKQPLAAPLLYLGPPTPLPVSNRLTPAQSSTRCLQRGDSDDCAGKE